MTPPGCLYAKYFIYSSSLLSRKSINSASFWWRLKVVNEDDGVVVRHPVPHRGRNAAHWAQH